MNRIVVSAAPRRATRARVNTRARLLDAAAVVFAERGSAGVGIDDICTRAGFTRGAFYSNFSTVDDLLFAMYERKTRELLDGLQAARGEMDDSTATERHGAPEHPPTAGQNSGRRNAIDQQVDRLLRVIPSDAEWYALRASFAVRARHDPAIACALREHGEELRRGLTPFAVELFRSAGLQLTVNEAEATRVIIAAHVGAVLQAQLVDDPERLRRDTVLAVVRGLAAGAHEARRDRV